MISAKKEFGESMRETLPESAFGCLYLSPGDVAGLESSNLNSTQMQFICDTIECFGGPTCG